MKHETNLEANLRIKKQGGARHPAKTITEMAEEFGVSKRSLAAMLGSDKNSPNPVLYSNGRVKNSWYNPVELRQWWRKRNDNI